MRRSIVSLVVLGAALIGAAPAAAQSYAGGLFPNPKGRFTPTMGIVLKPQGGTIALRFETTLRCGGEIYDLSGRSTPAFDGRSFSAQKLHWYFKIGRKGSGSRIMFSWRLRGTVDGAFASGLLRVNAVRRLNGVRRRCIKPRRHWVARIEGPAPTGSPSPPSRALYGGLNEIEMAPGLRGTVLLRVSKNGRRMGARWNTKAACGRRAPTDFTNYTPPMRIRPDGSFKRAERFNVGYSDAFIRYHLNFAGRVSGDSASGTLRLRAKIYSPNGKRLRVRCDSGVRGWSAGRLP